MLTQKELKDSFVFDERTGVFTDWINDLEGAMGLVGGERVRGVAT